MLEEHYLIRESKKNEIDSVVSFIKEHYLPESVVMNGFFNQKKNKISAEERNEVFEKMRKNVSNSVGLVAIHRNDNSIVGTVMLLPVSIPDFNKLEESNNSAKLSLMQEFDRCLLGILKEVRLFEKYSERKNIANMRYLTTHKDHRGKGLAKALAKQTIELSKRHAFDLIYSFYTLPGSKKSAERAGFTKVADYDLNTARDANGAALFADLGSYNITSVMAFPVD